MGAQTSALLATLALLTACATTPTAQSSDRTSVEFVDLTDDFAALYDASEGLPTRERAARMQAGMSSLIPDYYSAPWRNVPQDRVLTWFETYLAEYSNERAAIARVAARFDAMMTPGLVDFQARVGPLPENVPIYLLVSMGEFDGATRELGGSPHLLFGADMIAKVHGGNDPQPLVQHELFHIFHGARFRECGAIWCGLWSEGLATYAASVLNPEANDAELLLSIPEPIRPALEAHRGEAICAVLDRLDSTASKDAAALFSFERLSENLPPRFGYLVGAWVAQDLGRTRSLTQLAEMNGPELRDAIEGSLRERAECP
jgi:hypothetical protein